MLRPGAEPRTYRLAFRGQNSYNKGKGKAPNANGIRSLLVEVTGFEPTASSSRTKRSTKLSHTPQQILFYNFNRDL